MGIFKKDRNETDAEFLANKKLSRKEKKAKKKKEEEKISYEKLPFLLELKPNEHYLFRSDYFEIDNNVGTVLALFASEASDFSLDAFWGTQLVPYLGEVQARIIQLTQVEKMEERWVKERQKKSEGVAKSEAKEVTTKADREQKSRIRKVSEDLDIITEELRNGASYLHVQMRLLIQSETLESLEDAVDVVRRRYRDYFINLTPAPYHGSQRQELANLFAPNSKKRGEGMYFTSTEFAGAYNFVTKGINDRYGYNIGTMVGDLNTSSVNFDVNKYRKRVVVAMDEKDPSFKGNGTLSDIWASQISQACLLDGGRVVHIVLNGINMDEYGPKFETLTSRIDMANGEVNMFEVFGERKDQLSAFSAHQEKLRLMAEQAYETTDSDRSIIRNTLDETVVRFYVDQGMWKLNAKNHQDDLRIVGIKHTEVPRLQVFVTYLDNAVNAAKVSTHSDESGLHALKVLAGIFKNMLDANGDLFNNHTSSAIDNAAKGSRVIYDFSNMVQRGSGIALAQLVNIIRYAVSSLGEGDTVILHGVDEITSKAVKDYMEKQFNFLENRGGRVVYCYNKFENMLKDQEFNKFEKADYTIFGPMTENELKAYEKKLGKEVPAGLSNILTKRARNRAFIRRGVDNVIVNLRLNLGFANSFDKIKKPKKRQLAVLPS